LHSTIFEKLPNIATEPSLNPEAKSQTFLKDLIYAPYYTIGLCFSGTI